MPPPVWLHIIRYIKINNYCNAEPPETHHCPKTRQTLLHPTIPNHHHHRHHSIRFMLLYLRGVYEMKEEKKIIPNIKYLRNAIKFSSKTNKILRHTK